MRAFVRWLLAFALTFGLPASAWSYDLTGVWALKVENRSHHVVATLAVEFTSQKARSCMAGNWTRVAITSAATEDPKFFPVSGPLSFNIENNRLTVGIMEICDDYLMLSGALDEKMIHGEYYGLGLGGSSPIGFFTLSRNK